MGSQKGSRPWLVRMHHRMRTASFAMVFVATCLHIAGHGYSPLAWLYIAALLLIYPHLQYWRALRAEDPIVAEMRALLVDSVLLGIFVAAVRFSDWLTFSVALGTLTNQVANNGWRSAGKAILALAAGATVGFVVGGFRFSPHTDWPAALFCMIGLGGYLVAMSNIGYARNVQLRLTRKALQSREQELLGANEALQGHLVEIDDLRKELIEQANRDPLTGLFNRRYLDATLARELARCRRERKSLALIMIDIDHFKKYNDRYGHQAGDECLKSVACVLQAGAKRASDLAARYGGEEFTWILPDTDGTAARRLAESLRHAVEALAIPHEHSETGIVTISAGLAVMGEAAHGDVEDLLRAADEALYRAKWGGRNRVQSAPDGLAPQPVLDGRPREDSARLVWLHTYESGNESIDAQHRQLFARVNDVMAAVVDGNAAEEIGPLIDGLMRSLVRHFEDEEALMGMQDFPAAAEHAASHRALAGRAIDLVDQFYGRRLRIGELLDFLVQEVVVKHMVGADREFFPYVNALPPGNGGDSAAGF